ncbi:hypothetical protein [Dyella telluris]|uniref:Uncharacterized protein n=1 Tax=Dyella telluris TaxID=2763498 RepID=A0A7G8Q1S2_9GAMM|nr:hypothetical protein [Dyella telluris]QNK00730.1 hypothetical protein H8F01_16805 [Dyella telluris]
MTQALVELTPDHEATAWRLMDAVDAAQESGDVDVLLLAIGAFFDWQIEVGLLTADDFRKWTLPHLRDVMRVMVELDHELADSQAEIAVGKMDGRDGMADAGWAALVLDAYTNARQDLGLDTLMTPELRASFTRLARNIETRTDLACQLLHRHAHKPFSPAQGDHAEAWSTCKGARREAQDILELLDAPIEEREGWYLQRHLPQGGNDE